MYYIMYNVIIAWSDRYVLASESQIKVPIDITPILSVIIVSTPIFAHSTAKSPYNIR